MSFVTQPNVSIQSRGIVVVTRKLEQVGAGEMRAGKTDQSGRAGPTCRVCHVI